MIVEVSYDEENDRIFFTKITKKTINLKNFFKIKLYANKFDDCVKSIMSTRTFAILDFPSIETIEDLKSWGLKNENERKRLAKLLKEIYKLIFR